MKPMAYVDLIAIDDTLEAMSLRLALEYWGAQVTLHLLGQAKDLVEVLGGRTSLSPNIFLMCHGDERGILLEELAPEYEKDQPYHGVITAGDIAAFARVPGRAVINTGCATGTQAMAEAFISAGARTYIGPVDYPNGSASLFYSLQLGYEWLCLGSPLREAHAHASAHDAHTQMFRLFEA